MGGLGRDTFPQRAPQALLRRPIMPRSSLPHRAGSSLERTNTQRPPKFGSPSLALSTPNQNLVPLGRSAAGWSTASWSFSQTSPTGVPPCCRLARRNSIVNPRVKVCTARALSGRRAACPAPRMMPMRLFSARREGTVLIWSRNSTCKVEGGYRRLLLVTLAESRHVPYGVRNTMRQLFTPNGPFNNKGKKKGVDGLDDNWAVVCASGRNNFSGTDHGSGQWTVWAFAGEVRLNRQWCVLYLWHCWEKKWY